MPLKFNTSDTLFLLCSWTKTDNIKLYILVCRRNFHIWKIRTSSQKKKKKSRLESFRNLAGGEMQSVIHLSLPHPLSLFPSFCLCPPPHPPLPHPPSRPLLLSPSLRPAHFINGQDYLVKGKCVLLLLCVFFPVCPCTRIPEACACVSSRARARCPELRWLVNGF